MIDRSVLLPQPLGPNRETNSLAPMPKLAPSTASVVEPSRVSKILETPSTSMKAVRVEFSTLLTACNMDRGACASVG